MINNKVTIPLSETTFSVRGERLTFIKDERGKVTYVSMPVPEGEARIVRKE